jgi:6-phosphogluconolactonase (cycloisomerase 2 family)
LRVPSFVQYAWPHPSRKHLYVTTSNRGPGLKSDVNHVSAYRIDSATGGLAPHGQPKPLRQRATHMRLDPSGSYALNAHNVPVPGVTVHRINGDGTLGTEVDQPDGLDYGIYPHQVNMTPSGRTVVVVDRGNSAAHGKAEDPGALRSFAFEDGVLRESGVVAPNGGYGFGPRHVDFHPQKPWLYVSDEKRSRLYMFRMPDERIEPEAAYTLDTLADRANVKPRRVGDSLSFPRRRESRARQMHHVSRLRRLGPVPASSQAPRPRSGACAPAASRAPPCGSSRPLPAWAPCRTTT